MKIVMISDLHGTLPDTVPECDVLTIAGDVSPCYGRYPYHKIWMKDNFNHWLKDQPARNIVGVAGNHDEALMDDDFANSLHWDYLKDSSVIIDHVKFYGHPWTKLFCDWYFQLDDISLAVKNNMIPDDTDVLITHGPPYGVLDVVQGVDVMVRGRRESEYLGDKSLKRRVNELPNLKLHTFGHIHSSHGVRPPTVLSEHNTTFVNAAVLDERYQPGYKVIEMEI